MSMTPEEWKRRFMARVIEKVGDSFTKDGAQEVAQAEYDAVVDPTWNPNYMIDAPEESADESMSNWADDGP